MAERTLNTAQLLALQDDGAELSFETQTSRIEGFKDLIDKLNAMVEQSDRASARDDARTAADQQRSQAMLEILATLQKMVRNQASVRPPRIDMKPLEKLVQALNDRSSGERWGPKYAITYEFTFGRSQQGFVDKIRAEPVEIKELD